MVQTQNAGCRRFEGRTALVTAAASGIGRAIALRLLSEGANVLAADINASALDSLAGLHGLETLQVDVTQSHAAKLMVTHCLERFGSLDVLVNNAGLGNAPAFDETSDEDWDKWLSINLTSNFRLTREALPHLLKARGAVLNIASTLGLAGYQRQAVYSTAKAGVIGLTRNLAAQYGRSGVRVNAIAPGIIATPQTAARLNTPRFTASVVGTTPMDRPGKPEEIAGAAAFLCSDDAGYVTGQVLAVDGGATSSVYIAEPLIQCWEDAHAAEAANQ